MDELKATEASLSNAGAETTPAAEPAPVQLDAPSLDNPTAPAVDTSNLTAPALDTPAPSINDFSSNKYSQMLEDALNEPAAGAPAEAAPMESALPPVNPAATSAPITPEAPELSNMPEINYGQNDGAVLPPPPTPPLDMNQSMPLPENPAPAPAPVPAPASQAPDTFTIPGV